MAHAFDVGSHCALAGCATLDFLPVVCAFCGETFCATHATGPERHRCEAADAAVASTDAAAKAAAEAGSPAPHRTACPVVGCSFTSHTPEITMVACSAGCGARYCFAHRFPEQHNCPAAAAAAAVKAAAAAVKDEVHAAAVTAAVAAITSNEEKKQRGRKRTTAKKQAGLAMINLVKLKLSATGDKGVPAERRVYLAALYDPGMQTRVAAAKPFFFPDRLSIGKVLDIMADALSVRTSGTPALRLLIAATGENLNTESTLTELVSGTAASGQKLLNGATVVLTRLSDDEVATRIDGYTSR